MLGLLVLAVVAAAALAADGRRHEHTPVRTAGIAPDPIEATRAEQALPPALRPRGPWRPTAGAPIDPAQAALAFGQRSHWLQPWRSYLDTWPATRLRDAIGINFNVYSTADATARRLAAAGVRRARIELSWGMMRYDRPGQLMDQQRDGARMQLAALRRHGIRPLVLLNSYQGLPCPSLPFAARLLRTARHGDRTLLVDALTAARIVPGRTGIDRPGLRAGTLFTDVSDDGVVQLAAPLPGDLAAGEHSAHVLRYAPFASPQQPDGTPDPGFEDTLAGWLAYVDGVTGFVRRTLGDDSFDVEIWNELSFGSAFLDRGSYYELTPDERPQGVTDALLARTVELLRDPDRGLRGVAIADGFASQAPWPAASNTPAGLTALSKHPYRGATSFPAQATFTRDVPLDARGQPDYEAQQAPDGERIARDRFVPRYRAFFPEWFLSAIGTETLIRDLSPRIADVYGTRHGRHVAPPGRAPLEVWLTEMGMDPTGLDPSRPSPAGRGRARLSKPVVAVLQAKAALRTYVAYAGKGARAVYLYAADGPVFGLAGNRVAMRAIARLTRSVAGARPVARPRSLTLEQVADDGRGVQFRGDGTEAHPDLHARDVLAFLPFQTGARSWIVPVYAMTRDLARRHRPAPMRLRIGGLDGRRARVALSDPLTGRAAPVAIVERAAHAITVVLQVSDSPRLLALRDR